MNEITFVPSTGQFFLWTSGGPVLPLPDDRSGPLGRLAQAGWPARAQLVEGDRRQTAAGVLVELLDVLPVLSGLPACGKVKGALAMWGQAARFALDRVMAGRLFPRLVRRRVHLDDGRTAGWEARWSLMLSAQAERRRLIALARLFSQVQVAVPPPGKGPLVSTDQLRFPFVDSAQGLLRCFLDLCADTLVREAVRRGAYVRLGGWPADAWEQRLMRALTEDRTRFASAEPPPWQLAQELLLFAESDGLASPPSWQAGEPLRQVMERALGQARLLAERLARGEPAPRTLLPVVRTGGLGQAVTVTHTLLRMRDAGRGQERKAG